KMMEIPASGAVLVVDPPVGFGALGFEDRVSAVVCRPNEIIDVHRWLASDVDRAQAISDAGRKIVVERHSVAARGRQLATAIDLIMNGRFAGSRWSDGELCLESRDRNQE